MAIVPWNEINPDTLFGNNQLYRFVKLLLGGKEDSSNKTSSWNSTTNNTRYPTEKLVKDTLDGKADSSHSHSTWTSSTLNTYTTLYVNEALQLCHLHYDRSFNQADADRFYTWHTALVPSDYLPSIQVQGSFNQNGILYVNTEGTVGGKFAVGWSSSRRCIGDVWWHY